MQAKTKEINEENKSKKTNKNIKSNNAKKTNKKVTNKNTISKKTAEKKTPKKSDNIKATTKKASIKPTKKSTSTINQLAQVLEYYDLPYRYNETIVKILYQTPDTLFVYWDISDEDRKKYEKEYGENFFNVTRPVLIIHNDSMNYSFEIPINDFANSWYLHVNDSKCDYRVELGRRPNYYNETAKKEVQENINTDYIYVSSSNEIESPNDRVLFSTNTNNTVTFRNIKNNQEKTVSLYDIIKKLPSIKNSSNIPYVSEELLKNMYSMIYQNEDITLFDRITNPSSGNPSSGSMSSRFN